MKRQSGFTLIELMVVVAIIALIAAIAIPNLFRSRMTANEGSAVASMRTISSAEAQFQAAGVDPDPGTGIGQYAILQDLGSAGAFAVDPPFVDEVLAQGTKSGYLYAVVPVPDPAAPTFTATGDPADVSTGIRRFFVNDSGVITFTADGSAPDENSFPVF